MITAAAPARQTADLKTLAQIANKHHRAVTVGLKTTLHDAKLAGDALRKAKEQVKHGEWAKWIAENFDGSPETDRVYRRISENWSTIALQMEVDTKLTIERARHFLRRPKTDEDKIKHP